MSKKNYMLRKIFDIRIRSLFKNCHVAADFINGILFYENAVIHYDDILFFLSMQVLFLFLTVRVLDRKRWS